MRLTHVPEDLILHLGLATALLRGFELPRMRLMCVLDVFVTLPWS